MRILAPSASGRKAGTRPTDRLDVAQAALRGREARLERREGRGRGRVGEAAGAEGEVEVEV